MSHYPGCHCHSLFSKSDFSENPVWGYPKVRTWSFFLRTSAASRHYLAIVSNFSPESKGTASLKLAASIWG